MESQFADNVFDSKALEARKESSKTSVQNSQPTPTPRDQRHNIPIPKIRFFPKCPKIGEKLAIPTRDERTLREAMSVTREESNVRQSTRGAKFKALESKRSGCSDDNPDS